MFPTIPKFNTQTEEQVIIPALVPAVKLDEGLKAELLAQIQEETMVVVHCSYTAEFEGGIRIWNSTVLIDQGSGTRSKMLHAFNITIAPMWMLVPQGITVTFTLVFSALPKTCEVFTLWEDIPEPGGFEIRNIRRNKSDVYRVSIM
ncbi:MAG: hypothetical protein ACOYM0_14710 [Bacteroidales bacterium]